MFVKGVCLFDKNDYTEEETFVSLTLPSANVSPVYQVGNIKHIDRPGSAILPKAR